MSKFQYKDPLGTDRTLNTSRIDLSGISEDQSPNEGSISLYDAFSFSRTGSTKIASQRNTQRLRNLKGNLTIKNTNIFELMKMLALCENRYRSETTKLTQGISRVIFVNNVGIVGLISMLRPAVKSAVRCLKSSFLYRWKANSGFQRAKPRFPRRRNHVKVIANVCRKMIRRAMIKHFIEIRERVSLNQLIKKRKPSVRSPMESRSPFDGRSSVSPNKSIKNTSPNRSLSPNKSISNMSITSERQVDERTRREFKQSIQSKYKPENKPLERAMGASYFRNN